MAQVYSISNGSRIENNEDSGRMFPPSRNDGILPGNNNRSSEYARFGDYVMADNSDHNKPDFGYSPSHNYRNSFNKQPFNNYDVAHNFNDYDKRQFGGSDFGGTCDVDPDVEIKGGNARWNSDSFVTNGLQPGMGHGMGRSDFGTGGGFKSSYNQSNDYGFKHNGFENGPMGGNPMGGNPMGGNRFDNNTSEMDYGFGDFGF